MGIEFHAVFGWQLLRHASDLLDGYMSHRPTFFLVLNVQLQNAEDSHSMWGGLLQESTFVGLHGGMD